MIKPCIFYTAEALLLSLTLCIQVIRTQITAVLLLCKSPHTHSGDTNRCHFGGLTFIASKVYFDSGGVLLGELCMTKLRKIRHQHRQAELPSFRIIIIIIRHELGLDKPVLAWSNSLFKGLPSRLRPFHLLMYNSAFLFFLHPPIVLSCHIA
jgi:hypothetical protein